MWWVCRWCCYVVGVGDVAMWVCRWVMYFSGVCSTCARRCVCAMSSTLSSGRGLWYTHTLCVCCTHPQYIHTLYNTTPHDHHLHTTHNHKNSLMLSLKSLNLSSLSLSHNTTTNNKQTSFSFFLHLVTSGANLLQAPGRQQKVDVILKRVKGRVAGGVERGIEVGPEATHKVEVGARHRALSQHLCLFV